MCYYPLALDLLFPDGLMKIRLTNLTHPLHYSHIHMASTALKLIARSRLRSALFWDWRQHRMVCRFGTTYRSPSKMRPIGCPETSVANYHSTPRKIPEECKSNLHRSGGVKLCEVTLFKNLKTKINLNSVRTSQ